ncbi:hypothetical protein MPTK1_2g05390 [Marchantia polymorpha subsp. ruderalis]|uniref:Uncharacterized protein n=1 Tax=Marchantia polymorpha TaxID=3197 RepID=A0A2R6X818_MARPO|nr:hypothetical protein MARPO_0031s0193 [Marchantia polymorpha]BBN01191.1 hypothetical protein Mp_2g05390 [Marchantia polymorpha subsp. ruderalis]|eukprot:PTQ42242.1 hypothetical protein MARPO_0031s0193 [Marchantia polymorpha]
MLHPWALFWSHKMKLWIICFLHYNRIAVYGYAVDRTSYRVVSSRIALPTCSHVRSSSVFSLQHQHHRNSTSRMQQKTSLTNAPAMTSQKYTNGWALPI